jgi:hypothetical protein
MVFLKNLVQLNLDKTATADGTGAGKKFLYPFPENAKSMYPR